VVRVGGSMVRLLDVASLQAIQEWPIEGVGPRFRSSPALSADGRLLVTAGFDGQMAFLDLVTGQVQTIETDQPWGVSDMTFSRDGSLLVTSSSEGTICLWDLARRQIKDVLRGHLIGVEAVAFSPDGQRLASGSQGDEAVKLWDVTTWHEVGTLTGEGLIKGDLKFSPDGSLIAAINARGKAHLWRAPSFDEIARLEASADASSSLPQKAAMMQP
jgi:WD40 repeat protein